MCCQRELEASGAVVRFRQPPRADVVATKASYAVARHAGGEDWDSDDPPIRAAARKRGKAASDAETEWQMNRLFTVVGYFETDVTVEHSLFRRSHQLEEPIREREPVLLAA